MTFNSILASCFVRPLYENYLCKHFVTWPLSFHMGALFENQTPNQLIHRTGDNQTSLWHWIPTTAHNTHQSRHWDVGLA